MGMMVDVYIHWGRNQDLLCQTIIATVTKHLLLVYSITTTAPGISLHSAMSQSRHQPLAYTCRDVAIDQLLTLMLITCGANLQHQYEMVVRLSDVLLTPPQSTRLNGRIAGRSI